MNDCNAWLNFLTTGVDVLIVSSARPKDVVVLRIFPAEATRVAGRWQVIFDVQNVADGPLAIAPVVTAVFRGSGEQQVVCEIAEADCVIPMGTTKRFTAVARSGSEEISLPGTLHQVHVSLAD